MERTFYPQKTASKDFLAYYSTQFDTVEVDSTFYRIPTPQAITNWKNQTPDGFTFSLKFPNIITHIKMLKDCKRETDLFLERVNLLGEKLGPLLLQFPPNFGIEHLSDLANFLQTLPKTNRYVVEVRDKAFLTEEFYSLLRANKAAFAGLTAPICPNQCRRPPISSIFAGKETEKKSTAPLGKKEADQTEGLRSLGRKNQAPPKQGHAGFRVLWQILFGFPAIRHKFPFKLLTNDFAAKRFSCQSP